MGDVSILVGIDSEGQTRAVIFDPARRVIAEPLFDSESDAKSFLSYLHGLNPTYMCFDKSYHLGRIMHRRWLEAGKPPHASCPVFGHDRASEFEKGGEQWVIGLNLGEDCHPMFLPQHGNRTAIEEELTRSGVLLPEDEGCLDDWWPSRARAEGFIDRLNAYLAANWDKVVSSPHVKNAYLEGSYR